MEILGCIVIVWGPVGFYVLFTHRIDVIFWVLLGYGIFFFPMALLAVVMFKSMTAFNPLLWVGSIISTFFPYCGLVLLISAIGLVLKFLMNIPREDIPLGKVGIFVCGPLILLAFLYIVFVAGHLLGRFYWRYQKKLNWEV
jgi:hypothetical protein